MVSRFAFYLFLLGTVSLFSQTNPPNSYLFVDSIQTNQITLHFDNSGNLGKNKNGDSGQGKLNGVTFLFCGGFLISGYANDFLFANGVFASHLMSDYKPGNVNQLPGNPINKNFNINFLDEPFGNNWLEWSKAVEMGAGFYDGDLDSIYNPVDLNSNGKWDPEEDKPDIVGYYNYWTVYNDGIQKQLRRFLDVDPLGIEIHQTVFAFMNFNYLSNVVFIRYRICYKGNKVDKLDSVYFSISADPDLGSDWQDDYGGTDTAHHAVYSYQTEYDSLWGKNSAVFMAQFLQTPEVYIPGETFIDVNSNGIYDKEYDIPLDTALLINGINGIKFLPGAKNLGSTSSFISHLGNTYFQPDTRIQQRRLQVGGMDIWGSTVDPCTWEFGNGSSLPNCSSINQRFMFSGDPVSIAGWLPDTADCNGCDLKLINSTGPFTLEKEKPVDIYVAYIAARKDSSLASLTEARRIAQMNKLLHQKNFGVKIPIRSEEEIKIKRDFHLYQNFPNPFNPMTNIPFTTDKDGKVEIRIYNTLGEEVTKVFSGELPAGKHKVEFNAGNIPAGIYLCQLRLGLKAQTIKIALVK